MEVAITGRRADRIETVATPFPMTCPGSTGAPALMRQGTVGQSPFERSYF
jgi:hypothetical protein